MLEGFNYRMARWLPFQDQEACAKAACDQARGHHQASEPRLQDPDRQGSGLHLPPDERHLRPHQAGGRRRPAPGHDPAAAEPLYAWVADLCNKYRVSCQHLYTFDMDEYADQDGRIAPETWPNSFLFNMKHNFYAKLDPELRPPEHQIQGPTNANFKDYGKMIADLGGADVCYGGIGWCGHLAYIEPGAEAFKADTLEEWKQIGPRIVELTPITILQGCLGPEFGKSGDWSSIPPEGRDHRPGRSRRRQTAQLVERLHGRQLAGVLAALHPPAGRARPGDAAGARFHPADAAQRAVHHRIRRGRHRAGIGRSTLAGGETAGRTTEAPRLEVLPTGILVSRPRGPVDRRGSHTTVPWLGSRSTQAALCRRAVIAHGPAT